LFEQVQTYIRDRQAFRQARREFRSFETERDSRTSSAIRSMSMAIGDLRSNLTQLLFGNHRSMKYLMYFKGWVFACINAIAEGLADMEWQAKIKKGADTEVAPDAHWLSQLMQNPNPALPWVTWDTIVKGIEYWQEIAGAAMVWTPKNGATKPSQMWIVPPGIIRPDMASEINPQTGQKTNRFRFVWSHTGKELPDGEIAYFPELGPDLDMVSGMTNGQPRIEKAIDVIEIEHYISAFLKSHFARHAVPDFVIEFDNTAGEFHKNDWEAFLKRWLEKYQGDGSPAGELGGAPIGYLPAGGKLREVASTTNKKALQEMGMQNVTAIRGVFRVPMGILTGEFNSSAPATEAIQQHFIFKKFTLSPRAKHHAAIWTRWVRKHDATASIEVEPVEWSDPNEARADELHRVHTGRATINDLRRENNEEPLPPEQGDVLFFNMDHLVRLEDAVKAKPDPPPVFAHPGGPPGGHAAGGAADGGSTPGSPTDATPATDPAATDTSTASGPAPAATTPEVQS
jgi:hypothetical protein